MMELIPATMRLIHNEIVQNFRVVFSLLICVLSPVILSTITRRTRRRHLPLPPGPKSFPFVGYSFGPYHWRQMEKITKEYGPVSSVKLSNNKLLVIVGRVEPALALLEGRSSVYCDRPQLEMAGNIMSGGLRTLCLPYGDRWKRYRRVLHSQLDNKAATSYQPIQERASRQLILDILERPKDFTEALTRYAASVIIKITYGKTTPIHHSDEEVVKVIKTLTRFSKATRIDAHAVDRFPWLRYIPGWVAQGRKWHQEELHLFSSQVDGVRREMNIPGKRDSCFTSYMLERQKEFSLSDNEAAYLAGSLFGAGSDTTAAALAIVIFAAACHPEQVKKVQDELESVVGNERMPTFDDYLELPLVKAFVCETFRWRPASAAGFMHATVKDDVYEGHFIPAGSWVVGNHWSIHRDESVFPEPDKFDLERWLTNDDETGKTVLNPDMRHFAYGFGRRRCAGVTIADRSMFINTANLLWSFNIKTKKDMNGNAIELDTMAFEDATNSRPKPFEVDFFPRVPDLRRALDEMSAC
ncbi:hypothetical protein PTTG_01983 [Puccinia triticina 1-1 BBBD Race 1]|uniref:Cytochrome P450 n=2 Tax=Puccinia triticina TaxID=208348 RepID=A0A180H3I9_PUCT1|nr:uncharacterized protein PtA15_4A119 [Puccinia triticina]OAV99179.1 hypothetical protein PTTG_01983 [Puccinia triticina 1-1 BBBD Race 1]WAQ83671.1 hypothetical protein PtA15_4A119 [Puccinia triticina]WAR54520.1 hypothetical protein PtB15_4B137 [Puccinia triticina]